jgi:eukaryotic-like serine/threonine-protein kinase
VLFHADTEMLQIAKHLGHDGLPPPLKELGKRAELRSLTEVLVSTLRQDPSARPSASTVRKELARVAQALAQTTWPLGGQGPDGKIEASAPRLPPT